EVEFAVARLVGRIENALEVGDGGVEVFLVAGIFDGDEAIEPGDGPPRGRRGGRAGEGGLLSGLGQPSFIDINPGKVEMGVRPGGRRAQLEQFLKGLLRLPQLAALGADATLKETTDAVVIPALPGRVNRGLLFGYGLGPC